MFTTNYEWITPNGGPTQANNIVTFLDQTDPAIAVNPAGTRYLTVWCSDQTTIMGRFYHANGQPVADEFPITPGLPGQEFSVSAAALKDGRFIAVYTNFTPENGSNVRAQIFNADGSFAQTFDIAVGPEPDRTPDVTALADGGFAVTWSHRGSGDFDIMKSIYNADLSLRHAASVVNNNDADAELPSVIGLENGNFVVAWHERLSPAETEVWLHLYHSSGLPLAGTDLEGKLIDTWGSENSGPVLASLPDGGFVLAYNDNGWDDRTEVTAQVYHANGQARSSTIRVTDAAASQQGNPTIAVMPDGNFVVGWSAGDARGFLQMYDAVGQKVGERQQLGNNFSDTGEIATVSGGRLAHVWESKVSDGSDTSMQTVQRELIRKIQGDGSDDTIIGKDDAVREFINGAGGKDILKGGGGSDTLEGGPGDDVIAGGSGDDTAVFVHALGQQTVYDHGNQIAVRSAHGFDRLSGIEHLKFGDGSVIDVVDDGNGLFDTLYYFSRNTDVFHAGTNALEHFNSFGRHEGRDPNGYFDTSGYLAVNRDVAASGANPLDHYHQSGWMEGRDPSAAFDTTLYLINNPDVAAAGVDPLEHFLQAGFAEGRKAYAAVGPNIAGGFDAQYYLFHNPDVAAAGVDPLQHFNQSGWHEGRNPNAYFDTAGYLSHYADVAASGANPLQHYEQFGWHEGRDPSAKFDTLGYLAANPDVATAGVNPLDHFLQNGIYEGRQAVNDGLWH